MFSVSTLVIVASFSKLAVGQTIDPSTVDITTREKWCTTQKATCPLLCLQIPGTTGTEQNSCDAASLVFQCVCSNGQSPNASQYSQTVPYFECTESNNQCAANCGNNDAACVTSCRTSHPCGAQDPIRVNASTISTMAATASASGSSAAQTPGGSAVYTGFGSSATAASGSDGSSAAQALTIDIGRTYGTALVLSVVFGGFLLL